jgi:hypothetical protein
VGPCVPFLLASHSLVTSIVVFPAPQLPVLVSQHRASVFDFDSLIPDSGGLGGGSTPVNRLRAAEASTDGPSPLLHRGISGALQSPRLPANRFGPYCLQLLELIGDMVRCCLVRCWRRGAVRVPAVASCCVAVCSARGVCSLSTPPPLPRFPLFYSVVPPPVARRHLYQHRLRRLLFARVSHNPLQLFREVCLSSPLACIRGVCVCVRPRSAWAATTKPST